MFWGSQTGLLPHDRERSGREVWDPVSKNPPIRIVDQRWQLRRAGKSSDLVGKAYVAGLRPVVINNDLVQTRNDEVDCAASLDLCDLRNHHVRVEGRRRGLSHPVKRRFPCAKTNGRVAEWPME